MKNTWKWKMKKWWIKARHWEYWPFQLVYFPVFLYWIYLSFRARSFLFFTASNPSIRNGGLIGESKFDIISRIPGEFVPNTCRCLAGMSEKEVCDMPVNQGFNFPFIAKPDIGERGYMVRKIHNQQELLQYSRELRQDFMIQEFIDLPLEAGIFYYRLPSARKGKVSSIVLKEMLEIEGDGQRSFGELIWAHDRAVVQFRRLYDLYGTQWHSVPTKGQRIVLNVIGNHCLGTKFLNGGHLIDGELRSSVNALASQIEGFYFGRFDVRAKSIQALKKGDFLIMELNGAGAEPAHIYHPGHPLREGYRVLFHHWKMLFRISRQNHHLGIPYLSLRNGWQEYRRIRKIKNLSTI